MARRPTRAQKDEANSLVSWAMALRLLRHPKVCVICGAVAGELRTARGGRVAHAGQKVRVVWHHHDYSAPFDLTALCQSCHQRVHWGKVAEPATGLPTTTPYRVWQTEQAADRRARWAARVEAPDPPTEANPAPW